MLRRLTISKECCSKHMEKYALSISVKDRLLKATAFAVASYESKSWTTKSMDKAALNVFNNQSGLLCCCKPELCGTHVSD